MNDELFTIEDLETQIRLYLDDDDTLYDTDLKIVLNNLTDEGDYLELKFRGMTFQFDKETGEIINGEEL